MFDVSPVSPAIAFGLLAWLLVRLRRVSGTAELRGAAWLVVGVLGLWVVASSWIAWRGLYREWNAETLLIVGGTAMPFALLACMSVSTRVRALLLRFIEETPLSSLALVHVVRVLALGTVYKGWIGVLPAHFILPVGVPDMCIGLSALFVSRAAARDPEASRRLLIGWNSVGAVVLLIAPPLIQLSQPGPLQVFADGPRTDEVLGFPMSIVPTFVAPIFLLLHVAALEQLRRRVHSRARGRTVSGPA